MSFLSPLLGSMVDYDKRFEPRADREAFYAAALMLIGPNVMAENAAKHFVALARTHFSAQEMSDKEAPFCLFMQYISWVEASLPGQKLAKNPQT